MRTAIFKTENVVAVERLARQHLNAPRVGTVGRLVCVQSEELDVMTEANVQVIADTFSLPLVAVRDLPPYPLLNTAAVRALPAPRDTPDKLDIIDTTAEATG